MVEKNVLISHSSFSFVGVCSASQKSSAARESLRAHPGDLELLLMASAAAAWRAALAPLPTMPSQTYPWVNYNLDVARVSLYLYRIILYLLLRWLAALRVLVYSTPSSWVCGLSTYHVVDACVVGPRDASVVACCV